MNEKSSPSNRAPLKKYEHYEDVPRGEWFIISEIRDPLYGYRWHEGGSPDLYISRKITEGREEHEFDDIPSIEEGTLRGLARFLSGNYRVSEDYRVFRGRAASAMDDGFPCFRSYTDIPADGQDDGWYTISGVGGGLCCHRGRLGVYIAEEPPDAWGEGRMADDCNPDPTFYYMELYDVVRFFGGKDAVFEFPVFEVYDEAYSVSDEWIQLGSIIASDHSEEAETRVLGCLDDTEDMAIKLECHSSPIRITYKELMVLRAFMREEALSLEELNASYLKRGLTAMGEVKEGGQTV
jgi:hypothetical protein